MKKLLYSVTIIVFVFLVKPALGQSSYINHTLKTGETLSALAKQYNTHVGDIMRMNGMHADTKLVYGSAIKIPSNQKNKAQVLQPQVVKENAVSTTGKTVKHAVVKGETLYSIGKRYNVSTAQIKAWNHFTDNSVKPGTNLIVGAGNITEETSKPVAGIKRQRIDTTQQQIIQTTEAQPGEKNEVINPVTEQKPTNNADVKTNMQTTTDATDNDITSAPLISQNSEGYFENQFNSKPKRKEHASGISKTFKTASGWSDGKYYILADNINPGTVVKLTADNGKSVYAKVLWSMGDLKENGSADFRISNATAAALNENAASFNLDIYY